MALPQSPEAQRWREWRLAWLTAVLIFAVGFIVGWVMHRGSCLVQAAEQVIETAEALRTAQCLALVADLRPGLC